MITHQNRPHSDTDDQPACVFHAQQVGGHSRETCCGAQRNRQISASADRFRPYRVSRRHAAESFNLTQGDQCGVDDLVDAAIMLLFYLYGAEISCSTLLVVNVRKHAIG